jgi:hypothetical protein
MLNSVANEIAVENFPGEVTVYDLSDGERRSRYRINGDIVFMRFNPRGDRLFLFNDRQSAYVINVPKRHVPATP